MAADIMECANIETSNINDVEMKDVGWLPRPKTPTPTPTYQTSRLGVFDPWAGYRITRAITFDNKREVALPLDTDPDAFDEGRLFETERWSGCVQSHCAALDLPLRMEQLSIETLPPTAVHPPMDSAEQQTQDAKPQATDDAAETAAGASTLTAPTNAPSGNENTSGFDTQGISTPESATPLVTPTSTASLVPPTAGTITSNNAEVDSLIDRTAAMNTDDTSSDVPAAATKKKVQKKPLSEIPVNKRRTLPARLPQSSREALPGTNPDGPIPLHALAKLLGIKRTYWESLGVQPGNEDKVVFKPNNEKPESILQELLGLVVGLCDILASSSKRHKAPTTNDEEVLASMARMTVQDDTAVEQTPTVPGPDDSGYLSQQEEASPTAAPSSPPPAPSSPPPAPSSPPAATSSPPLAPSSPHPANTSYTKLQDILAKVAQNPPTGAKEIKKRHRKTALEVMDELKQAEQNAENMEDEEVIPPAHAVPNNEDVSAVKNVMEENSGANKTLVPKDVNAPTETTSTLSTEAPQRTWYKQWAKACMRKVKAEAAAKDT